VLGELSAAASGVSPGCFKRPILIEVSPGLVCCCPGVNDLAGSSAVPEETADTADTADTGLIDRFDVPGLGSQPCPRWLAGWPTRS
jgi:hypothetical protein